MGKKDKSPFEKFRGLDGLNEKQYRQRDEFDATKPSVLIGLTIVYAVAVFSIIIGVPWQGVGGTPIPPEDLPVAIPIFIGLYVVVIGGLYLRNKMRK